MSIEQAIAIAKTKMDQMLAADLKAATKEVIGTALSMGVTIDGKPAKQVQREIDEGLYDEVFAKEEQ